MLIRNNIITHMLQSSEVNQTNIDYKEKIKKNKDKLRELQKKVIQSLLTDTGDYGTKEGLAEGINSLS